MGNSSCKPRACREHAFWHRIVVQIINSPAFQEVLRSFSFYLEEYPGTQNLREHRKLCREIRDHEYEIASLRRRRTDRGSGGENWQRVGGWLRELDKGYNQGRINLQYRQNPGDRDLYNGSARRCARQSLQESNADFETNYPVSSEDFYHFARLGRHRSRAPFPQQPRSQSSRPFYSSRQAFQGYQRADANDKEELRDHHISRRARRRRRKRRAEPPLASSNADPYDPLGRNLRPLRKRLSHDEPPHVYPEADTDSHEQQNRYRPSAIRRPSGSEPLYPNNQGDSYARQPRGKRLRPTSRSLSNHVMPPVYPKASFHPHENGARNGRHTRQRPSHDDPPYAFPEADALPHEPQARSTGPTRKRRSNDQLLHADSDADDHHHEQRGSSALTTRTRVVRYKPPYADTLSNDHSPEPHERSTGPARRRARRRAVAEELPDLYPEPDRGRHIHERRDRSTRPVGNMQRGRSRRRALSPPNSESPHPRDGSELSGPGASREGSEASYGSQARGRERQHEGESGDGGADVSQYNTI